MADKATKRKPRGETPYQRRVRRYAELHPGATKQAARGHKPREHVERKQREIERTGFSPSQAQVIAKLAREINLRTRERGTLGDPAPIRARLKELSWSDIERLRTFQRDKRAEKRQREKNFRDSKVRVVKFGGRSPVWDDMEDIAEELGIPIEYTLYN